MYLNKYSNLYFYYIISQIMEEYWLAGRLHDRIPANRTVRRYPSKTFLLICFLLYLLMEINKKLEKNIIKS